MTKQNKGFYIDTGKLTDLISKPKYIELVESGLEPYSYSFGPQGKSIKHNCLRYSKQEDIVLVMVDNDIERLDNKIKLLRENPNFNNKHVRGILIKPFEKCFDDVFCSTKKTSIPNNSIKVLHCKFDFLLHEKQVNSIPISLKYLKELVEDYVSDYYLDHLYEIENNLHPNEHDYNGCRNYKINGRKIDLFCKDKNDKTVVVEIKKEIKNTYNSYESVGQILCYIRLVEKEKNLDNVRGIILIPKEATDIYKKDIQLALECCQNCREIKLLYYSAALSFVE